MSSEVLDRLLTTLSVRLHAFAICEIRRGYRLSFDPMEAVTIHYVLEGSGILQSGDGEEWPYKPHCIMVVPARSRQTLGEASASFHETRSDENCVIVADGLLKFVSGQGELGTRVVCGTLLATYGGTLGLFESLIEPIVIETDESELLRQAFLAMVQELANPRVGVRAMTEALMKQCLILLLRQELRQRGVESPFFLSLQDHRLARAVTAILEEPAQQHTVGSLAEIAAMSRSAFAERFSKVFGQSPIEFLTKVRLRMAAHLLATTDVPVKLISKNVGYASRSHFSRAFRDTYGHDPASFRTFGTSPEDEPWADRTSLGVTERSKERSAESQTSV